MSLCGSCDALQAEIKRLEEERDEAEARCCPEDMGFEEYIGLLHRRILELTGVRASPALQPACVNHLFPTMDTMFMEMEIPDGRRCVRCGADWDAVHPRKRPEAASPAPPDPPEGWQPISTAPKDGTWLLVTGCNTSPLVLVAGYRVEANRRSYPEDRWVAWGNITVRPPTHWMRLPDPPEEAPPQT